MSWYRPLVTMPHIHSTHSTHFKRSRLKSAHRTRDVCCIDERPWQEVLSRCNIGFKVDASRRIWFRISIPHLGNATSCGARPHLLRICDILWQGIMYIKIIKSLWPLLCNISLCLWNQEKRNLRTAGASPRHHCNKTLKPSNQRNIS